jgi:hypothetical protein
MHLYIVTLLKVVLLVQRRTPIYKMLKIAQCHSVQNIHFGVRDALFDLKLIQVGQEESCGVSNLSKMVSTLFYVPKNKTKLM